MGERYSINPAIEPGPDGNARYKNAPAGLYLTRGDGAAVEVTARMLARADDPENWDIMTPELQREIIRKAQKRLDLFLAPLMEPING